jgi:hypothetical protein
MRYLLLLILLVGCADSPRTQPPPAPVEDVARLRHLLAVAEADAAAAEARAEAEAAKGRTAVIRTVLSWTSGLGAGLGLIASAAWLLAIWWRFPIGRTLLAGTAVAGFLTAALALAVGETVPLVVAVGPWLLALAAAGTAGVIGSRLIAAGRAGAVAADALEAVDPADEAGLVKVKRELVEAQRKAGVLELTGWLRGKSAAEVKRAVERLS